MALTCFAKRHSAPRAIFAVLSLLGWGGAALFAQAAVWPSPQAPAGNPAAVNDPTRPEAQPPLDVDRDPIATPDVDVPPPRAATPPSASSVPVAPSAASNTTNSPASQGAGNQGTGNQGSGSQATGIEKQQNGMYILHANVDEVLLNCAVMDEKGQPVMDLSKENFRVWEDGVPQTVNAAQHLDLPVSMGILIDDSGSMRDKRSTVNAAAYRLLNASNPEDEAFVVNFSDRPYLDQGFTTDRVALNRGLSRYDPAGTTALYDAVAASAGELSKHGKNRKQVLLIVTDGGDNASRLSLQETIRRVQGLAGPVVYSIGLLFDDEPQESKQARDALDALTQETGGVAYYAHSLDEVSRIAAEVARDIREQYVVDYHSSRPFSLGGYRSVRIEAISPSHGPMSARTKRGYNPKTEQTTQPVQNAEQ